MKKYIKKPIVVEASQWFKNGDHPLDRNVKKEGKIVRNFSHPFISGDLTCKICGNKMHDHGWIGTLEGGHIVCPSDWIIKGIQGEFYPCKNDIFQKTYDNVK